jgi:hypothetical protein
LDGIFIVGSPEVESGDCFPHEIGRWGLRHGGEVVLVSQRLDVVEAMWANIAPHLGYAHN